MTRGHDDDGRFARFRGKEKIAFDQKFCRIGINFDRNNSFERNDKRTPRALARMAISHGRLSAILPTRNDKFYPRVQRRSSRAFSYVSSSRVCMCVCVRARACTWKDDFSCPSRESNGDNERARCRSTFFIRC